LTCKASPDLDQIEEAVQLDGKNKDALSMRGSLELKRGEWGKAKETFKSIQQAENNDDTYAALSLVSGWQRQGQSRLCLDANPFYSMVVGGSIRY
jgi:uncharacterized protein HemY